MCRYRIFISYSHDDRALAEEVAAILRDKMHLEPLWDKNIRPGSAFADAIKGLIMHAHIFMPLITDNSKDRPWVHQETGYAMALNIPILPVAVMNEPDVMIKDLHAINVKEDLSDLEDRLTEVNIENVIVPRPNPPLALIEAAEWAEKRMESMVQNANRVFELGYSGCVRQQSAFSTFGIPDEDIDAEIWKNRDGAHPKGPYHHFLQLEERRILERHTREEGCILVVDPTIDPKGLTPDAKKVRLESLLQFLRGSVKDGFKAYVVCSDKSRDANITIVGDWFVAESRIPRIAEGWRNTVFNWHSPTVLGKVRQFDQKFDSLLKEQGLTLETCLETSILKIKSEIDRI